MNPPNHWREHPPIQWAGITAARAWDHKIADLRVLRSKSTLKDGSEWIHLSVSRPDRLPSWPELVKVLNEFIGEDIEVYQVIPAKADYVNVHSFCLHLWAPMDGERRVANLQDLKMEEAL